MTDPSHDKKPQEEPNVERRSFMERAAGYVMAAGLAGSVGGFAGIAAQFMYPSRERPKGWLYLADIASFAVGHSIRYVAPTGEPVTVARKTESGQVSDFIALSSTCPHLGCQVHWEGQNNRFFCPCHNGVFNPDGVATEGPPAAAKQSLAEYPLKIEDGLLFIEVPMEGLST